MGLIEVHRAFHEEVVISCPMEHEYIPLAQLIPIPFCGTNYGAYFGDTLPRVFTMIQAGRFDEATDAFHQLDPARKAFASVPNFSNGNINRMMWKAEGWLMGYNGGPIRHPTSRVYDRNIAALRRGLQLAGLTHRRSRRGFFVGRHPMCVIPATAGGSSWASHDRQTSSAGTVQDIVTRLRRTFKWSGRRDSNPRPSPWQGDALPAEPRPR